MNERTVMEWLILFGAVAVAGIVLAITRKIIRALVTGLIILVVGGLVVFWMLQQGMVAL